MSPVLRADTQVGPYTRPNWKRGSKSRGKPPCVRKSLGELFARCSWLFPFQLRRSRQGKSSASVSWMQALLPVARSSWRRSAQELRKLGWIEGKNITIEYRFAEQKPERLPELAADLVRLKVDLIVVTGAPSALAAKSATTTIPIVMTNAADPVGCRFGCQSGAAGRQCHRFLELSQIELNTKRLEILKDAVPKLARVGLLRTPEQRRTPNLQLKDLRAAAEALKLKLEEIETQVDAKGLESAFQTAKQKQVKAIMTTDHSPIFRGTKADRRACRQIPLAGYLLPEGVCR